MVKNTIYIIGAGPSGLITSLELLKKGYQVIIIEKSDLIGGMCRTWKEGSYLLDTGPHIYHTPDKELSDLWKKEFGDVLIEGEFWSKNVVNGDITDLADYPLSWEAINQYKEPLRTEILSELLKCDQTKSVGAKNFSEYVKNLVGPKIAEMFFTKYPEKVWGIPTSELTADWAPKRIEIREKRTPFYFRQYAAVGKYGTGSIYEKIKNEIIKLGGRFILGKGVSGLTYDKNRIIEIILNDTDKFKVAEEDIVISTIPITILGRFLGIETDLKFRGITSLYIAAKNENISWPSGINWLYFDSEKYSFNRITNSSSLTPYICPEGETLLTIETTYSTGDNLDKLSKKDLEDYITKQVIDSGLVKSEKDILFISSNKEPFVYPLQYRGFQMDLAKLKSAVDSYYNLYSIGTGGDFNYADSQVLFYKAFDLVSLICEDESKINQINKTKVNRSFNKVVQIKNIKIGDPADSPTIIGEIGLNHNGNPLIAKELIDKAVDCGLKFIKLQTYKSGNSRVSDKVKSANYIEKITDQEETLSQLFDKYNMAVEEQVKLFEYARSKDLIIFSTPFDIESAIFLNDVLQVDCYKIASVDLVNLPLIKKVASFGKPIILSCGMSNLSEIEDALDCISSEGNNDVILLHCNSSYPAPLEEMNLSVINTLSNAFKLPVGLSDHTFGLLASTIALSIGAKVIERHFTLDRFMDGPDHILSSEPEEMAKLVEYSKLIPKILGDGIKKIQNGEYFNINLQRKCIYAGRDILEGETIQLSDLVIKGPGGGILPKYIDIIVGKTLRSTVKKDFPITWGVI